LKKYQIYGIGAALVDTEVVVSDEFLAEASIDKGVMTLVDQARQADILASLNTHDVHMMHKCGGSACNSVVAASSFGASAFFSGKVADDADGELFVHDLSEAGVDVPSVGPEPGVTGKCLVMVTSDAERTMNTYLGASEALSEREIDKAALINSEWFYVEGYLVTDDARSSVIQEAVGLAKTKGVKVALSLSDPFVAQVFGENLRAVIGESVDHIFCNKDEAVAFTETDSIEEAFEALKRYTKTFAVTDGGNGAFVFDGETMIKSPGVAADAVDTNGAGDMFAGAFLYAVTAGRDFKWAAELANESAARVVGQFGPRLDAIEFDSIKAKFEI